MGNDLAEKIIENGGRGNLVEDDLGLTVEENIADDPARLCRYLLVRILKRMGRPYRSNQTLYINGEEIGYRGEPIRGIKTAILRYIDSPIPVKLSDMQIQWLYNRLYELSAPLDNSVIQVAEHLFFDINKGEFEQYDR